MTRPLKRALLIASLVWVLLIGVGAYLAYPSIGQIAVSIEPNPLWSVEATGIESAPFRVSLKTRTWVAVTLVPVTLLWVLAFLLGRRSSGHAA
jgi:hypothetical protein